MSKSYSAKRSVSDAVAYFGGLALTCAGAWLSFITLTPSSEVRSAFPQTGALGATWFIPASYLAAWCLLSYRNLTLAMGMPIVLFLLCLITFNLALVLGFFTFGLLILPVSVAGILVISLILSRLPSFYAPDDGPHVPLGLHCVGLILALFALNLGSAGLPMGSGLTWDGLKTAGAIIGGGFGVHAMICWALMWRAPAIPGLWLRAGVAVAIAWGAPIAILVLRGDVRASHAWPLGAVALAEVRYWDRNPGHLCSPGASAGLMSRRDQPRLAIGERVIDVAIPAGWLACAAPAQRGGDHDEAVLLRRDPRLRWDRSRLVTALVIDRRKEWHERRSQIMPPDWRPPSDQRGAWGTRVCTQLSALPESSFICRDSASVRRFPSRLPGLELPEAQVEHRAVLAPRIGLSEYSLIGPNFGGECQERGECTIFFLATSGKVIAVRFLNTGLAELSAVIAEAAGILRKASGLEFLDTPRWEQPEGEVLRLTR